MNKITRKIGVAVIALVTIVSVSGIAPAVAQTPTSVNIAPVEIREIRTQINVLLSQLREFISQLTTLQARINRIIFTPPCERDISDAQRASRGRICTMQIERLICPHDLNFSVDAPNGCIISYLRDKRWVGAPTSPIRPAPPVITPPTLPISLFEVNLQTNSVNINQGASATLIWNATGAANCRIISREAVTRRVIETRHVNLSGERRVSPSSTTIYTLTCNRRDNMREANSSEVTIAVGTAVSVPAPTPIARCRATGCSSQVCADQDVITTCEFRPEFACYRTARCEHQAGGQCGWTMTPELQACLALHLERN